MADRAPLLSTTDAAKHLGVSTRTLQRLLQRHAIEPDSTVQGATAGATRTNLYSLTTVEYLKSERDKARGVTADATHGGQGGDGDTATDKLTVIDQEPDRHDSQATDKETGLVTQDQVALVEALRTIALMAGTLGKWETERERHEIQLAAMTDRAIAAEGRAAAAERELALRAPSSAVTRRRWGWFGRLVGGEAR